MSLSVDVLGITPLALVRAVLSVPAGRSWTLTGGAGGWSWPVAAGVSDGGEVVLSDPWAPLGIPATYTLTHGGTQELAGPVTRVWAGESALTDLSGRTVVDFRWMAAGGDPQEGVRRARFFDVPGSEYPPALYAPVAGAGEGSLLAQTVRPHTDTLRDLLRSNGPLILLHNEGRCQIPGCDVRPSRTVYVTSDSNDRTGHVRAATRGWALTYRMVLPPAGWLPPVATVADLRERFASVGALTVSGLTVGGVKQGDW